MAVPMIYQNSRDAQAAGAENGMDNESTETTPDQENGEQASPQEQQQYNDLVTGGMTLLYKDENAAVGVAKALKAQAADSDLATAIGQQAAKIMLALTRGLKEQGLQPDPDVVLNAGVEIISEVADIAQVAKLLDNADYDKTVQDASYEATRYYGEQEMKSGGITPEMQKQAQAEVAAQAPKDQGSLAGMSQQPAPEQQPPAQGASLAQMTGAM